MRLRALVDAISIAYEDRDVHRGADEDHCYARDHLGVVEFHQPRYGDGNAGGRAERAECGNEDAHLAPDAMASFGTRAFAQTIENHDGFPVDGRPYCAA